MFGAPRAPPGGVFKKNRLPPHCLLNRLTGTLPLLMPLYCCLCLGACRVTVPLLSNLGTFVIRIRILCILHVSCMYSACILMCPVIYIKIHFRYIKIHLYLSLWLTLGNVSYLGIYV